MMRGNNNLEEICEMTESVKFQEEKSKASSRSSSPEKKTQGLPRCFACGGQKQVKPCEHCKGRGVVQESHPLCSLLNDIINLRLAGVHRPMGSLNNITTISEESSGTDDKVMICDRCTRECDGNDYSYCLECPTFYVCKFCRLSAKHKHLLVEHSVTDSEKPCETLCEECHKQLKSCFMICQMCQNQSISYHICVSCFREGRVSHMHKKFKSILAQPDSLRLNSLQMGRNDVFQRSEHESDFLICDGNFDFGRISPEPHESFSPSTSQKNIRLRTGSAYQKRSIEFSNEGLQRMRLELINRNSEKESVKQVLNRLDQSQVDVQISQSMIDSIDNGYESGFPVIRNNSNFRVLTNGSEVTSGCDDSESEPYIDEAFEQFEQETSEQNLKQNSMTSSTEVHPENDYLFNNYQCDYCQVEPIRNVMYHCTKCQDFDLCQSCYTRKHRKHVHNDFTKIDGREKLKKKIQILKNVALRPVNKQLKNR